MKVRTVFYLTIATLLLTSAVEARGLFGNLGRAIRDSVRQVYSLLDSNDKFEYVLHDKGHSLQWSYAESFLKKHL